MKNKDIIAIFDKNGEFRQKLSELYERMYITPSSKEYRDCSNKYEEVREKYEQWLEQESEEE